MKTTTKYSFRWLGILTGLILLAVQSAAVLAAPPQTLDYQGYLTDNANLPINGATNITINIYAANTGGSSLWSQTESINIVNGLFSMVLDGSGINPFPAALFENPLWAGITVAADPEMTPRSAMSAAPYALHADTAADAQNLSGLDGNVLLAVWQYSNFDGGLPTNDDPREGLIDTDNDGTPNFADNDNDNDGILDAVEVTNNSDVNLITPQISSLSNNTVLSTIGGTIDIFLVNPNNLLDSLDLQVYVDGIANGPSQQLNTIGGDHVSVTLLPAPLGTVVQLTVGTEPPEESQPETVTYGLINRVFLTSSEYDSNFGGVAGADSACQTSAANAGITGTFKAWISESGSLDPEGTFTQSTINYGMVDDNGGNPIEVLIADDWTDLTDGTINTPINIDEFGMTQVTNLRTWTNVSAAGAGGAFFSCNAWTGTGTNSPQGGDATMTDDKWSLSAPALDCVTGSARLYCFEQ